MGHVSNWLRVLTAEIRFPAEAGIFSSPPHPDGLPMRGGLHSLASSVKV